MKQVLYFSAKWCTACQATTPIVENIKKSNRAQVAMVDVDYDVTLTQQYNVRSVPTTIVLENNNEIMTNDETTIPFNNNYYITDLSIQPTVKTIAPPTTKQPDTQQIVTQENRTNLNNATNINVNNVPGAVINSSSSQNVDNSALQSANRNIGIDVVDNSSLSDNRNNSSSSNVNSTSPESESNARASSNMSGDTNVNRSTAIDV